jgi:L-serine dehydratase
MFLFDSFKSWEDYRRERKISLHEVVLEYEQEQKGHSPEEVLAGLNKPGRL